MTVMQAFSSKLILCGFAIAFLRSAGAAPLPAPSPSEPVAQVDGAVVTRADVLQADRSAGTSPAAFASVLQEYINTRLLASEAERKKIDQQPTVRDALAGQRMRVLAAADQLEWLAKHAHIDDARIAARYAAMQRAPVGEEYRLREIVVHDRSQAQHILGQLAHGTSFSMLAASMPLTPNAALGGELGWLEESRLQPVVREAIDSLKVGEVTGPVVVPSGLAIVQLLGKRVAQLPPLQQMRPSIVQELRVDALRKHINALRAAATIKLYQGAGKTVAVEATK